VERLKLKTPKLSTLYFHFVYSCVALNSFFLVFMGGYGEEEQGVSGGCMQNLNL